MRQIVRFIVSATLLIGVAAGSLAVQDSPLHAGRVWCFQDPVVLVDGEQVNIVVAVPEANLEDLSGPVITTLVIPPDSQAEVLYVDQTHFPESVQIVTSDKYHRRADKTEVSLELSVGADDDFEYQVTITGHKDKDTDQTVKKGHSNHRLRYKTDVHHDKAD